MPGWVASKLVQPWLGFVPDPIGRFCSCVDSSADDRSPLAAWMTGACAVTSTDSCCPPIVSVSAGTTTRSPPLTVTPVRVVFLNPLIVTSTV